MVNSLVGNMIHYPVKSQATFLGTPAPSWPKAKVALLPIPYDATTSYQSGARFGPEAMLAASNQLELFDEELNCEPAARLAVYTLPPLEPRLDSPRAMIDLVRDTVKKIVVEKKFPLLVGGEHSLTLGAVEALYQNKTKDFSILHCDAHMDFRNEFEGTRFNHACVMRRSAELVPVTSVGIRSVAIEDRQEASAQDHRNIFYAPAVPLKQILKTLRKKVYITIDVDVFDPGIMPSTGTPQPGGLSWFDILSLLRAVTRQHQVIGADVMEFMPIGGLRAPDFLVAKLVYKLLSYCFYK